MWKLKEVWHAAIVSFAGRFHAGADRIASSNWGLWETYLNCLALLLFKMARLDDDLRCVDLSTRVFLYSHQRQVLCRPPDRKTWQIHDSACGQQNSTLWREMRKKRYLFKIPNMVARIAAIKDIQGCQLRGISHNTKKASPISAVPVCFFVAANIYI